MLKKLNKLWYQQDYSESEKRDLMANRNYIQRYIDLYCPERFNVPEDVTSDNLQEFLEIILKYYQLYLFSNSDLVYLAESIYSYFHQAYDEFPKYHKNDRKELALYILCTIERGSGSSIIPKDVPVLIKCLNIAEDKIVYMYGYIDSYFEQCDYSKRIAENSSFFNLINQQRKEAIEKGQPLPIRPMGIEIDLYYKK
jgi:hypothetical protein